MTLEDALLGFILLNVVVGGARLIYVFRQTSNQYNQELAKLDELDRQIVAIHKKSMRNLELLKVANESEEDFQSYLQSLESELNIRGVKIDEE